MKMKPKYLFNAVAALICAASLNACYEDKSSLESISIDEVTITANDDGVVYIGQMESLDIVPSFTQGDSKNPDGLEYEWAITVLPNNDKEGYEIIGTDPELHYTVSQQIDNQPYLLKLTVTDTKNDGLQYLKTWQVYVQSAFLDGLLVCDTKDDTHSDLTLVLNDKLTVHYDRGERIFRNIIESTTGSPFPRKINTLFYNLRGEYTSLHVNHLWIIDENKKPGRFNLQDFSYTGIEDIMYYAPEDIEFYGYSRGHMYLFCDTNNGIYGTECQNSEALSWPLSNIPPFDNHIVGTDPIKQSDSEAVAFWLDKQNGQLFFVTVAVMSGVFYTSTITLDPQKTYPYDPNDLKGKSAIAAGLSTNGTIPSLLLKDDATGDYTIYTVTPHEPEQGHYADPDDSDSEWIIDRPEVPLAPRAKFEIPASGKALLDDAIGIFFSRMDAILYVTKPDGIYAINFAGNNALVESLPKYTPSDGEKITSAKLYQQGIYTSNHAACEPSLNWDEVVPPQCPMLDLTNRAVIVTTQKSDTEGTVYIDPMTQIGTGNLDASKALKYDGFGKILDVTTTGY